MKVATIVCNGCFDLLHEGHRRFLLAARNLGHRSNQCKWTFGPTNLNHLIVCVNSDASAQRLKLLKWGDKYPIDNVIARCRKLMEIADNVVSFDTEEELHGIIEFYAPCIIVKGPDYAGKRVTGDDIAPVIILDTPEPESVKRLKVQVYGQEPSTSCSADTLSDR